MQCSLHLPLETVGPTVRRSVGPVHGAALTKISRCPDGRGRTCSGGGRGFGVQLHVCSVLWLPLCLCRSSLLTLRRGLARPLPSTRKFATPLCAGCTNCCHSDRISASAMNRRRRRVGVSLARSRPARGAARDGGLGDLPSDVLQGSLQESLNLTKSRMEPERILTI